MGLTLRVSDRDSVRWRCATLLPAADRPGIDVGQGLEAEVVELAIEHGNGGSKLDLISPSPRLRTRCRQQTPSDGTAGMVILGRAIIVTSRLQRSDSGRFV